MDVAMRCGWTVKSQHERVRESQSIVGKEQAAPFNVKRTAFAATIDCDEPDARDCTGEAALEQV
jgi:hypothetical protein